MSERQLEPVILYFGNDWGAENRTSSHQIARCLASKFRVYYLEAPGLRAPQTSARDLKKIWTKVRLFLRGVRPCGEEGLNLRVRTLFQIPLHRFALVRWLNRRLLKATVRWLKWREGIQHSITWFMLPHLPYLVGQCGEQLAVYYCIDDYAALPNVNADIVRRMDEETTRKADLVFIASDTLLEGKLELNPHTWVSPHGVDYNHFAQAQDPQLAIPADTAHHRSPIVGFFGLIEQWIDLDLVDYLAAQRPNWTFLLIGRVAVAPEQLPRRPNVHLLGKRPYETLPAYGKQFDAAIIPYRLTQQVLHANPIKLREYLAMGKPVVSVSTPEIDKFADVVEIARTPEEFLAKLDQALARPSSAEEVQRRRARVASSTWPAVIDTVLEIVHQYLTPPGHPKEAAEQTAIPI